MHFAQVAFALLAGGAAILIVAGLVLEALHEKQEPLREFGAFPDPLPEPASPEPTVVPVQAETEILEEASPSPRPRGDHARHDQRGRSRNDAERQRRKQRRQKEKGNSPERRSNRSAPQTTAETEDA